MINKNRQNPEQLMVQAKKLYDQGKLKEAIQIWQGFTREDSDAVYAMAQLNLGVLLRKDNDIEGTKRAYNNIQRSDSAELYAIAQLNLGNLLRKLKDIKGAKRAYNNIKRSDSAEAYALAQFQLDVFLKEKDLDIEGAKEILNKSNSFPSYYMKEIVRKILDLDTPKVKEALSKIPDEINNIMANLLVDKVDTSHEKKVAHYTRVQIAWSMIGAEKPSQFRLSTIQNVNDPKEGLVLYQYINKKCSLSNWVTPNTKEQMGHTFISCFTFNHDSLNQFRLYGKEDEREASGVSLVFTHDFFN